MRYPYLYKFTNLVSIVTGIGFLIFYIFFNFGYAYFYPLGAVLVIHFFKDFLNCNMKLNSIQIYNFINFFKKDIQRGSII